MSFTLRVRFTGMCMFVRDGAQAVHVLLPSTAGTFPMPPGLASDGQGMGDMGGMSGMEGMEHGGADAPGGDTGPATMTMPPHTARITFDTAHLRPGHTGLDEQLAQVSIKGRVLGFPADGGELSSWLPQDLVSLGGTLKPEALGDDDAAESLLTSRITFRSGRCTGVAPGRCWRWQGQVRRMSHVVEWTIDDCPGDSLALEQRQFGGGEGTRVGALYPVNGEITLVVWHAPYTDLPPDPIPAAEPTAGEQVVAHHFAAMLRLLQDPPLDLPLYAGNDCTKTQDVRIDLEDPMGGVHRGAASVSCMGGQGG